MASDRSQADRKRRADRKGQIKGIRRHTGVLPHPVPGRHAAEVPLGHGHRLPGLEPVGLDRPSRKPLHALPGPQGDLFQPDPHPGIHPDALLGTLSLQPTFYASAESAADSGRQPLVMVADRDRHRHHAGAVDSENRRLAHGRQLEARADIVSPHGVVQPHQLLCHGHCGAPVCGIPVLGETGRLVKNRARLSFRAGTSCLPAEVGRYAA